MKLDFDILSIVDFEEMWINEDFQEINFYFIGPKEPISDIYPEAEHFTIHLELVSRTVMISPTKEGEDYDWSPLELDSDTIDRLVAIAALRSNANRFSRTKKNSRRLTIMLHLKNTHYISLLLEIW